jgi:phage-related holin
MKTSIAFGSLLMTVFGLTFTVTPMTLVHLLVAVVFFMFLDLGTGIAKAKVMKEARTSEGYRRTVKKLSQYLAAVVLSFALKYLVYVVVKDPSADMTLSYLCACVLLFIILIEVTSICENTYAIDPKSKLSRFLIKPLLIVLKFGMEKNPLIKEAEKLTNENNTLSRISHEGYLIKEAEKLTNENNTPEK